MTTKRLLLVMIVLCGTMQLSVLTDAACVCKEPGSDQCARCSEHTVVHSQPQPNQMPPAYAPIGDNCWCNQLRAQPGVLPKTCNKHKSPQQPNHNYNVKPHYAYQHSSPKAPLTYNAPIYNNNNPSSNYYVQPSPPKPTHHSTPADPVSISLAIRAGKPETKFAYGFVHKSIDDIPKIRFTNLPNENLYNKEVITLKKEPYTAFKPEDETPTYDENEEDEYMKMYDKDLDYKLTYKQLGYQTEHFINSQFRKAIPTHAYPYPVQSSYKMKSLHAKTGVDSGFKPSQVTSARHTKCNCKE